MGFWTVLKNKWLRLNQGAKVGLLVVAAFIVGIFLYIIANAFFSPPQPKLKPPRKIYTAYKEAIKLTNQAVELLKRKETSQAIALLKNALNTLPPPDIKAEIYFYLGYAYDELGKFWLAAESIKKALELKDEAKYHHNLGIVYLHMGKLEDAEKEFKKAIKKTKNPSTLMALGNLYLEKGQVGEAIKLYEEALEKSKNNPSILYNLALAYWKLGAREKVVKLLKRAMAHEKNKENLNMIKCFLAKALNTMGKSDEAVQILVGISDEKNPFILYRAGYVLVESGHLEKGIDFLRKAFEISPEDKNITTLLAESLYKTGNIQQAISVYRKHLEKKKEPQLLLRLADLYFETGKLVEAERLYKKIIEEYPQREECRIAYNNLANLYCERKAYKKAVSLYLKSIEIKKDANVFFNLALACEKSGDVPSAIKYMEEAAKINPSSDIQKALARLYWKKGKITKSIEILKKVINTNPSDGEANLLLAEIYRRKRLSGEALRYYEKAQSSAKTALKALLRKGSLLEELGKYDEAIESYRTAVIKFPDSAMAHYNLAVAYINRGWEASAMEELQKAKELTKDKKLLSKIHTNMGYILYKQGKIAEARTHFEKALQLNPANAEARLNLEIIEKKG